MNRYVAVLLIVSWATHVNCQVPNPGQVYLTFDDGPIDASLGVLDVLQETNTSATFFVNGFHLSGEGDENEDRALEALQRMVSEGHVVANHCLNHMLHNCCNDQNECGAVVCNQIEEWNINSYQNEEQDAATFFENTRFIASYLGQANTPSSLSQYARLPYTNAWRFLAPQADGYGTHHVISVADCPCCTTDDLPPWDPAFAETCGLDDPTESAKLASRVANRIMGYYDFEAVFGWNVEWAPESWGDDDPASTLTTAEGLLQQVRYMMLLSFDNSTGNAPEQVLNRLGSTCTTNCETMAQLMTGKVVVLAHDFLFEDGKRGMGATTNLPKLREFIELVRAEGFEFKTMDNYYDNREVRSEMDPYAAAALSGASSTTVVLRISAMMVVVGFLLQFPFW